MQHFVSTSASVISVVVVCLPANSNKFLKASSLSLNSVIKHNLSVLGL